MGRTEEFIDYAPFLEPDYPLFSWDDFPKSRDSLVRGKPVSLFETACWNNMVFKMYDVMIERAWEWDPPIFSYGESKTFTADMYTRMFYAMVVAFPLYRYEFNYPKPGDYLTAEHLRFVAKYLNKIISIARGSDTLAKLRVGHNSTVTSEITAVINNSWPITASEFENNISRTVTDMKLEWLWSAPIHTRHIGNSNSMISVLSSRAEVTEIYHNSKLHFHVVPEKLNASPGAASVIGKSVSRASIQMMNARERIFTNVASKSSQKTIVVTPEIYPFPVDCTAKSHSEAEAVVLPRVLVDAESINWSNVSADPDVVPSLPFDLLPAIGRSRIAPEISCKGSVTAGDIRQTGQSSIQIDTIICSAELAAINDISRHSSSIQVNRPDSAPIDTQLTVFSKQSASADTRTARPAWVDVVSKGNGAADVELLDAVNVTVSQSGETAASCTLDLLNAADIQGNTLAFSKTSCEAAIWLLPLQPDSKTLFIRQTYKESIKIGDTLYVDEWPDQGLTDDGTLFLWKLFDTVLQVGNTLYIGSMPDTGMTDGRTLLIWDVEQEPVQTLNLLEVF